MGENIMGALALVYAAGTVSYVEALKRYKGKMWVQLLSCSLWAMLAGGLAAYAYVLFTRGDSTGLVIVALSLIPSYLTVVSATIPKYRFVMIIAWLIYLAAVAVVW